MSRFPAADRMAEISVKQGNELVMATTFSPNATSIGLSDTSAKEPGSVMIRTTQPHTSASLERLLVRKQMPKMSI